MTDNLLQKLEERMMSLLSELEHLRKEHGRLKQEYTALKTEQVGQTKKLQGLVSLLDALDMPAAPIASHDFDLSQSKEEFATV